MALPVPSPVRPVLRQLPYAVVATLIVLALPPVLAVLLLPAAPTLETLALCGVLTFALWRAGDARWRRHRHSVDLLFADLMLWGWARRLVTERRIARLDPACEHGDPDDVARRLAGLERLSAMVESRDAYTHRHSLRVTRYAEAIARELGLAPDEIARVRTAATLHDVGKYLVPRTILNKPEGLTDGEFAVVKRHAANGANMVTGLVEPAVVAMIRHHHERIDGSGYPAGLVGESIPLGARIIAVADTFDAMTSSRAYRSARAHAEALAVLGREAGTQLDARAVAAFEAVYSGRRGIAIGWLATTLGQLAVPLLSTGSTLTRALPALGVSAALSAPILTPGIIDRDGRTPARDGRERGAGGQVARAGAPGPRAARTPSAARAVRPPRDRRGGRAPGRAAPGAGTPDRPRRPAPAGRPGRRPVGVPQSAGPALPAFPQTPADDDRPRAPAPATATAATTPAPQPEIVAGPVTVTPEEPEVAVAGVSVELPDLPVKVPGVSVAVPDLPAVELP